MPGVPKPKPARCEDCYFRQNMLCALNLGKPCTTFRPAERGLAPERQLAFVFRTERTTAAYAFPRRTAGSPTADESRVAYETDGPGQVARLAGRRRRVLGVPDRGGRDGRLIDCGNGVFAKLREQIDYVDVDAVVISHLHADHFLDLVPYSYALTYAPRQQPVPVDRWPGTDSPARPELHAPPGARETFRKVVGCWGNDDLIENAFDLTSTRPTSELEIGPVRITFQPVPHFTGDVRDAPSPRERLRANRLRSRLGPTEALNRFAIGADLLLVEATLPRPERTGKRGHLTPAEAGRAARAAGAKRLLLVHISDELDPDWARREAERPSADLSRWRGGRAVRGLRSRQARCARRPATLPSFGRAPPDVTPRASGRASRAP